jgi:hypothetical protein
MDFQYKQANIPVIRPQLLIYNKSGGVYINTGKSDSSKADFPDRIFIRKNKNPKIDTEKVLKYSRIGQTAHLSKLIHIGKWKRDNYFHGDRFTNNEHSFFILRLIPNVIIIKLYPLWMPEHNQRKPEIQAFMSHYLKGMRQSAIPMFFKGLNYD